MDPSNGNKDAKSRRKRITTSKHISDWRKELDKVRRDRALLDGINRVLRETLVCESTEEVAAVCLDVAETLTISQFGFVGMLNAQGLFDTMAISNPGWDACSIPKTSAVKSIANMQVRGLWGAVIHAEAPAIVNEPEGHPDSVGLPEGHPALTAFMGVPLKRGDQTVGMLALGNKEGGYDKDDLADVEALSLAFSEALGRRKTEQLLARQARELLELSTPIMQVWEGIIVAPLIGNMDSIRTMQFTERLLQAIEEHSAEVVLVDITGVPTIDTHTAQHLLETTQAVKLLGARVVLTGIRPAIAQTIVQLGIDMTEILTRSSLMEGLRVALEIRGAKVVFK